MIDSVSGPAALITYPDGAVTSPTAVVSFNGSGRAVTNVAMAGQLGYAFVKIDVPFNGATVQVRILPDLVDGSTPGLKNIFAETVYDVALVREVEPGKFLLDTSYSSSSSKTRTRPRSIRPCALRRSISRPPPPAATRTAASWGRAPSTWSSTAKPLGSPSPGT
jgi:hypothetical protein